MIEQLSTDSDRVMSFRLSGLLHYDDYKAFVPMIARRSPGTDGVSY
jgi:hypothetical protein